MMNAMVSARKLLLPAEMVRAGWDLLAERGDVQAVPFDVTTPTPAFHSLLVDAEGVALITTPFGEAEIRAAPRLRVVARLGVGFDRVDVPALTRHGIPLMVTGDANSASVAEHALYFMLELAKRGAALNAMVREGRWMDRKSEPLPLDLFGKTVLVVGFGRTGTRIARACLALGMTVHVHDPYVESKVIEAAGCVRQSELDAALPHADFVTVHCPKTAETLGMLNVARLARMKPTAYLVSTARGGIIDEPALHAALTAGVIRGAALDVFDREPPAPDGPLLKLPNVIASPHLAGVTKEASHRMAVCAMQNLLSALDGRPNADNVVNREVLARHRTER